MNIDGHLGSISCIIVQTLIIIIMFKEILLIFPLLLRIYCQDDDPLSTPEGYLKYDIKKGASLNPDYESVGYWNGSVFGWMYDNNGLPVYEKLFLFEGFNVRKVYLEPDGHYVSLSREVSVYKDKYTGDVLLAWTNSYSDEDNEVFPVANDPVNAQIYPDVGVYAYFNNHTNFALNVMLNYPNPLPPTEYQEFSSGEDYIGGESFLYFTKVRF